MSRQLFLAAALVAGLLPAPWAVANDQTPPLSRGWRFEERDGASLYAAICQGCHMAQGQGADGAGRYPALAGNARLASPVYVLRMVLHGRKAMPGFARGLDDAQVQQVVNEVTRRFAADPAHPPAPVSLAEVQAQRAAP